MIRLHVVAEGQTEEAFAFHAKAFGTEVTMLSRYSDMPAAGPEESSG